ncbi:hypothetical protein QFZ24_007308 [Streptomyces phaeochromogenes]|jgi:hypothetical protein|uniref:DUF3618 domain-containing protein n=1 Tax=Streptomyces phaeochromogenes TaxID=1923 RepID=UPI00278E1D44|nr:DUF3618 domain-containing protein [Streptomyces phaeochromogenes]MDQ0953385.1 hypothetical protein [Streptomyces phaeochromogenes]
MKDRNDSAEPGKAAADKAVGGAKGPDELRRQIQETRGQLGDTVEELAAKADVKGRARARGAELKGKASEAGHAVQGKAAQAGHVVQDKATEAGHVVQGKAVEAGHMVQDKAVQAGHVVQDKATKAGHAVQDNVPRPVRTAVTNAVQAGKRHPRPVLIAGAGAVVAVGLLRRRHNGHH